MSFPTSSTGSSSPLRNDWRDGIQLTLAVLLSFGIATLPFDLLYLAALGVCSIFATEPPPVFHTVCTIATWLYMLTVFPILFLRMLRGFRIGFYPATHRRHASDELDVA